MVKQLMVPMEIKLLQVVMEAALPKHLGKDHKLKVQGQDKDLQQLMEVQFQSLVEAVDLHQFQVLDQQVAQVVDKVQQQLVEVQVLQVVQALLQLVAHQAQAQLQSLMDVKLVVRNNALHVNVRR